MPPDVAADSLAENAPMDRDGDTLSRRDFFVRAGRSIVGASLAGLLAQDGGAEEPMNKVERQESRESVERRVLEYLNGPDACKWVGRLDDKTPYQASTGYPKSHGVFFPGGYLGLETDCFASAFKLAGKPIPAEEGERTPEHPVTDGHRLRMDFRREMHFLPRTWHGDYETFKREVAPVLKWLGKTLPPPEQTPLFLEALMRDKRWGDKGAWKTYRPILDSALNKSWAAGPEYPAGASESDEAASFAAQASREYVRTAMYFTTNGADRDTSKFTCAYFLGKQAPPSAVVSVRMGSVANWKGAVVYPTIKPAMSAASSVVIDNASVREWKIDTFVKNYERVTGLTGIDRAVLKREIDRCQAARLAALHPTVHHFDVQYNDTKRFMKDETARAAQK
ncbi:MAG: hypothetical protein G01um101425_955 [Candidatus Peregrinibacteria bacterium Gr01-1014_25]|nr:MAG: hypothetical protein G01um101425_955 [Candidatus Peregrinibacteria bacterium Gr01-1014_25]